MLAPGKHIHFRFAAGRTTLRMTIRRTSYQVFSVVLSKRSAPKDPSPKGTDSSTPYLRYSAQNDRKNRKAFLIYPSS